MLQNPRLPFRGTVPPNRGGGARGDPRRCGRRASSTGGADASAPSPLPTPQGRRRLTSHPGAARRPPFPPSPHGCRGPGRPLPLLPSPPGDPRPARPSSPAGRPVSLGAPLVPAAALPEAALGSGVKLPAAPGQAGAAEAGAAARGPGPAVAVWAGAGAKR